MRWSVIPERPSPSASAAPSATGALRTSGWTTPLATSTLPGTSKYSVVATSAGGNHADRTASVVVVVVLVDVLVVGAAVVGEGLRIGGKGKAGTVSAGSEISGFRVVVVA